MSVCAKFQLSSWSRSGWKVCGRVVVVVVEHVTTMSNSNASCFRVELSWVELSCVGFWQFLSDDRTIYVDVYRVYQRGISHMSDVQVFSQLSNLLLTSLNTFPLEITVKKMIIRHISLPVDPINLDLKIDPLWKRICFLVQVDLKHKERDMA